MTEICNVEDTQDTKVELQWVASNIGKFIAHDRKHALVGVRTLPAGTEYVGQTLPMDVQIATHRGPNGPIEYIHFPLLEDVVLDKFLNRNEELV